MMITEEYSKKGDQYPYPQQKTRFAAGSKTGKTLLFYKVNIVQAF